MSFLPRCSFDFSIRNFDRFCAVDQGGTVKGDPVVDIIKTALDAGINTFDNAE